MPHGLSLVRASSSAEPLSPLPTLLLSVGDQIGGRKMPETKTLAGFEERRFKSCILVLDSQRKIGF